MLWVEYCELRINKACVLIIDTEDKHSVVF